MKKKPDPLSTGSTKSDKRQDVGPDGRSLYYKNKGLFSDPYLDLLPSGRHDQFILEHWDTDDTPDFNAAFEWMQETWEELGEIFPTLSEAQLEERWIQPILKKLGWEYEVQDRFKSQSRSEIPDYSLFASLSDYKKSKKAQSQEGYFNHVLAVADAKAMGIDLDGSKLDKSNPSFQIVWYMQATGKDWGILTNGRHWRLYTSKAKSKYVTYFEIDLDRTLASTEKLRRDDESFKYFYNFFRKESFVKKGPSNKAFLDAVFESGERYALDVELKLRGRAFQVVETIAQGFVGKRKISDQKEMDEIYKDSLFYLFRLMFVLNCEAKGLFNVGRQSDYYSYSLNSICSRIREEHETGKPWANAPATYFQIKTLFEILRDGDDRIGVHGFGHEAFSTDRVARFDATTISDRYLNQVLMELAFSKGDEGEYYFIDYKRLSADHLGSIFEGLLEYKLVSSEETGEAVLVNSSGERKESGSFYTPEYVVDYIVRETLAPLVENLDIDEILELKIADIAMGSAHFLLGVVRFLEEQIQKRIADGETCSFDPQQASWKILHSCVFGVDTNPLAVELGKFSLWIYTARTGNELEPLEDQLKCANSLVDRFNWKKEFPDVMKSGGFAALTLNPPYLGENDHKEVFDEIRNEAIWEQHLGKMDYWYFFVHKAVEILRKDGRLGIIATDYWRTNEGAKKLRNQLANIRIEKYISFGEFKVFESAKGQHNMILVCDRSDSESVKGNCYQLKDSKKVVKQSLIADLESKKLALFENSTLDRSGSYWGISSSNGLVGAVIDAMEAKSKHCLSKIADIAQGIAPGPDKLNSRNMKRLGKGLVEKNKLKKGQGVFVLSNSEINLIAPSSAEKQLLKKFVAAKDLRNGESAKWNGKLQIFYSTVDTCPKESTAPSFIAHIKPCRQLMEERRETENGVRKWFHLHWPRETTAFEKPGIVAVRMTKDPIFAWTDGGLFFDLSVNMIIPKNAAFGKHLFLYLQSDFVKLWLRYKGKMKGDTFQVDGKPLRQLPVPDFTKFKGSVTEASVAKYAEDWFEASVEGATEAA